LNNKLSDKDKLDWQNFVNNKEKLEIKDKEIILKKLMLLPGKVSDQKIFMILINQPI